MDTENVIKLLIDNSKEYKGNIEEILSKYFEQNPESLQEWKKWFKIQN